MDGRNRLEKELLSRDFSVTGRMNDLLRHYRSIAAGYATLENAIAVLSDMGQKISYIHAGRFAAALGLNVNTEGFSEPSIWEESLFRLIHPEDLDKKHLDELMFFHFVNRQPRRQKGNYYLISRLRMRTPGKGYIPVLHRMYYIRHPENETVWLALCLYSPATAGFSGGCCAVNSVDGTLHELAIDKSEAILTPRERQVLRLIDKGCSSKEIAEILSISKNTVSRHRQEIIAKLQVKNSIEACRIAKDLRQI